MTKKDKNDFNRQKFLKLGSSLFNIKNFYFRIALTLAILYGFLFYIFLLLFIPDEFSIIITFILILIAELGIYGLYYSYKIDPWKDNTLKRNEQIKLNLKKYLQDDEFKNPEFIESLKNWYYNAKEIKIVRKSSIKFIFLLFLFYYLLELLAFIGPLINSFIKRELYELIILWQEKINFFVFFLIIVGFLLSLAAGENYLNRFRFLLNNIWEDNFNTIVEKKNKLILYHKLENIEFNNSLKTIKEQLIELIQLYHFNIFGDFTNLFLEENEQIDLLFLHTQPDLYSLINILYEYETFMSFLKMNDVSSTPTNKIEDIINKLREEINSEIKYRKELIESKKFNRRSIIIWLIGIIITIFLRIFL